jgi:FMN phosphatase YigB (HAD superfamily)
MIKAIFFDMDGTLLGMDETKFTKLYFHFLSEKLKPYGYDQTKLLNAIMKGLERMYLNDGKKTNEDVFWQCFNEIYGEDKKKDMEVFRSFYLNEFANTKIATTQNPYAKEIVSFCRKNFDYTILSTNPIFPAEAQQTRMSFVGLKPSDFDFVTDYSNSSYCKPNPKFFSFLLDKFHLRPEEVILFGNDYVEDGDCASFLGIKVYLINGCLLKREKSKTDYPIVEMNQVIDVLKKEMGN